MDCDTCDKILQCSYGISRKLFCCPYYEHLTEKEELDEINALGEAMKAEEEANEILNII